MKIAVCIPIFGGVETPTFFSILNALNLLKTYKPDCNINFFHTERRPIYWARQELWDMTRYSGCNRMIFLSEDIVLKIDTLIKLAETDFDIFSVLYFERQPPHRPMVFRLDDDNRWHPHNLDINGKIQVVDGVGLDCISFSREVIDKIPSSAFLPFEYYTGDDLSFFIHVKKKGYDVFLDTSHKVGHVYHKKRIIWYEDYINTLGTLYKKSEWHKE